MEKVPKSHFCSKELKSLSLGFLLYPKPPAALLSTHNPQAFPALLSAGFLGNPNCSKRSYAFNFPQLPTIKQLQLVWPETLYFQHIMLHHHIFHVFLPFLPLLTIIKQLSDTLQWHCKLCMLHSLSGWPELPARNEPEKQLPPVPNPGSSLD